MRCCAGRCDVGSGLVEVLSVSILFTPSTDINISYLKQIKRAYEP